MDDLYIDIGASLPKRKRKRQFIWGTGQICIPPFEPFGRGMIKGPALDDRAGCAVLIELLKRGLRSYDIVCALSPSGGNQLPGWGEPAAFRVNPDIGVILEATTARISPGWSRQTGARVGRGPVLSFGQGHHL